MICEWPAADMRKGSMRKYGKAVSLGTWGTDVVTAASHFTKHSEETRGEVAFEKGIHNSRQRVTAAACSLWLQGVAGGR